MEIFPQITFLSRTCLYSKALRGVLETCEFEYEEEKPTLNPWNLRVLLRIH